ncbi:bifunctional serine/threonine-protein kinase/ABC transporter substrate-binding protein [Streptomyces sp. C11-1]|uniref:Bifunctional serine/threonine-protein kinase/ABC transporter substrate-binding protein n=1 Tax=Streptomyces durocortorensis TaxID=2811104 RepID=A0ABY9W5Y2_9ACTN|nr:bifunctional serine/threonine-protein kinase/ABC transporter substrate-binding protein [Streptomyces durocortorensis]WNF30265.1 bifunctional serine/threonine-protein kinase/ABC transporter substrate-binding protein [Streptomyces durocortorensis]
MRPLTSEDPRTIGPYRALARLGAGGMGVVHLARSAGGALAAVKVIRAEHAADPAFRARFRREAEAAARVSGPWTVPVLGADTEAREPWLATAYVPGPSLGEVVGAGGALPPDTVAALGRRLAEALAAVHTAGLIHRDVKPGNVLLALDGPRLIDFGIARHEGATALTATDAVIGTPGYLAPEQATAGPLGPACDVFSLGCVLAYAATGRRPFGEGGAAGVLFRTIHEDPDLTGVPPVLLPVITACLAKDPSDRPPARRIAADPGAGASPDLRDPREAWGQPGTRPDSSTPWVIPAGLTALIAERSAAALTLPDPEPLPTTLTPAGDGTGDVGEDGAESRRSRRSRLARRRLLTAGAAGAVLLTGGSTAAWLAGRQRRAGSGGPSAGSGEPPTYTIGLHADLSGPGRATGLAHRRGVELAVADHNSRKEQALRLALRTEDDAGDPRQALRTADRLGADPEVIAVVGPTGDVLREEIVERYAKARLAPVVVAAGATTVETGSGADLHLCLTRTLDRALATGLIGYLVNTRPAKRILLVQDAADPVLGGEIGGTFRNATPTGSTLIEHPLPRGAAGYGGAARKAVTARADAVVHAGGDASRAARLATALADAGFTGTRLAAGPALGPAFLTGAGRAAEGWVFAEAYSDPAALPAARAFTAAHRKRFGAPPATWAAEAYDAVHLIARAAGATSASGELRSGMARRLVRTEHRGIVRTLAFHASTRQARHENGIFLYRIENGRPRFLGPYDEL